MQRRTAFTLTEMLVAIALVLFIMGILAQIFQVGQSGMDALKSIGNLEARLRTATTMLRGELGSPHFGDYTRLSDPTSIRPTQGFFVIRQGSTGINEGSDGFGMASVRATDHVLHFTARKRGNRPENFYSASLPNLTLSSSSNTPTANYTSFDTNLSQLDARYQDLNSQIYNSQWAEVAYFLLPNTTAGTPKLAGTTQLYNLYRTQYVVVPDNSQVGGISGMSNYPDMSCKRNGAIPMLNTPADLVTEAYRTIDRNSPPANAANPLLTDVISFQVQILLPGGTDFVDVPGGTFDTSTTPYTIKAVRLTLRIWDAKSQQARQISLIQDM